MSDSEQQSSNEKPVEFTIQRDKWLRGEGSESSYLYRPIDGKMCCLGFYGQACGLSLTDMEEITEPRDIHSISDTTKWSWLVSPQNDKLGFYVKNSDVCADLMVCNDDTEKSEVEREQTIIDTFLEQGITVKFV